MCDLVNHTCFPKDDHLPYWASGQQSYEGWSCIALLFTAIVLLSCYTM